MSSEVIWNWNNRGKVFVWSYRESGNGWGGYHLTADREGCRFLLGLVARFQIGETDAHKKFALAEVTRDQLEFPNYGKKAVGMRRLELKYSDAWEGDHFTEHEEGGDLILEMGRSRLGEFEKGIRDITNQDGDWAMSGDQAELWFWWGSDSSLS